MSDCMRCGKKSEDFTPTATVRMQSWPTNAHPWDLCAGCTLKLNEFIAKGLSIAESRNPKSFYCPHCGTENPGYDLRIMQENPIGVIDRAPVVTITIVAQCCRSILSVALANAAPGAR